MIIITHKYLGDSYTAKSHYMGAVKFGAKLDRGTKCCKTHLNPKHLWVQYSSTHSSARLVVDRYVPMRQPDDDCIGLHFARRGVLAQQPNTSDIAPTPRGKP